MKLFRLVLEFKAEADDDLQLFVEGVTALDFFDDAITARIELVEIFDPEDLDGSNTNAIEGGNDSDSE